MEFYPSCYALVEVYKRIISCVKGRWKSVLARKIVTYKEIADNIM